jgi:hypothetical protein
MKNIEKKNLNSHNISRNNHKFQICNPRNHNAEYYLNLHLPPANDTRSKVQRKNFINTPKFIYIQNCGIRMTANTHNIFFHRVMLLLTLYGIAILSAIFIPRCCLLILYHFLCRWYVVLRFYDAETS